MAKIVIAIEDYSIQDAIQFDLKGVGHEAIRARSAQEAKEKIEAENPEIVITDLHEPLEDGRTLLETIKTSPQAGPPFIVLTNSDVKSMEDLYDQGAEIVFQPPFNRSAVLGVVQDALERIAKPQWGTPRVDAEFNVRIQEMEDAEQQTFNIGRGGMFIQCAPPMPPVDSVLSFVLVLEGGKEINGKAIVRWQRRFEQGELPRGIGVEFLSMENEDRESITRFVNEARAGSYIPKS